MPIVSISLTKEILHEIEHIQKSMGFSGRSDAIRAGIRSFVAEEKQNENLSGNVNAILLVVHNDEYDDQVNGIKHSFEDLINPFRMIKTVSQTEIEKFQNLTK